jgi:hypothetical protein
VHHHHHDAKEKKKEKLKFNKKQFIIFLMVWSVQADAERIRQVDEALHARLFKRGKTDNGEEVVWSARVGEIRNRLTGQKRKAKERWNRFAGTSGGGGRGL